MIMNYSVIALGGAAGAVMRVAVGKFLPSLFMGMSAQVLFVNIFGCFMMGLLTELMAFYWPASQNMRYFLVSGFLGSFTTFSAFSVEFALFVEKNDYGMASLFAVLVFSLSIIGFFVGLKLIRAVLGVLF
ncbi:MAG: fluoride efflux transporter CrcB [Alphaproteobacteria bacterium]|nr:fluoride efflux transporter CrcB [Alphaproteobacteria bacterium]NCQ66505.1 fluoride efflux transporter CrcB [Alphaproteobacteria bacterium]NCT08296.1 fluoride efflux transporter CrcB [Alphaproteobacteria bacterium]